VRRSLGYVLVGGAVIAAIAEGLWAAVGASRAETDAHSVAGFAQAVWALGGPTFLGAFIVGLIGAGLLRSDTHDSRSGKTVS
jgi:hypothetical protein